MNGWCLWESYVFLHLSPFWKGPRRCAFDNWPPSWATWDWLHRRFWDQSLRCLGCVIRSDWQGVQKPTPYSHIIHPNTLHVWLYFPTFLVVWEGRGRKTIHSVPGKWFDNYGPYIWQLCSCKKVKFKCLMDLFGSQVTDRNCYFLKILMYYCITYYRKQKILSLPKSKQPAIGWERIFSLLPGCSCFCPSLRTPKIHWWSVFHRKFSISFTCIQTQKLNMAVHIVIFIYLEVQDT